MSAEHFKALAETSKQIAEAILKAFEELLRLIRGGVSPKDAVTRVLDTFKGEYYEILNSAMTVATGGVAVDMSKYTAGNVSLSSRLYANSEATSSVVTGIVNKHTRGWADARALALELYEGYGFNPEEPLNLDKPGQAIPRHLKEALLPDKTIRKQLSVAYSRAQTRALKTGALRAAYSELLDAIEKTEGKAGQEYLAKKLDVAFQEKMRYFSNRIAQTELHRAFAIRQAIDIMQDTDTHYVQWRLNPAHPVEDICDYFAGVDKYGLGPGVYPKELAPVAPAHPFCKCILFRMPAMPEQDHKIVEDADQQYFSDLPPDYARKVAGSAAKLERVQGGDSAWDVHNANIDPIYQVKTVSDVAE